MHAQAAAGPLAMSGPQDVAASLAFARRLTTSFVRNYML